MLMNADVMTDFDLHIERECTVESKSTYPFLSNFFITISTLLYCYKVENPLNKTDRLVLDELLSTVYQGSVSKRTFDVSGPLLTLSLTDSRVIKFK